MARFLKNQKPALGQSPGSLVYIGSEQKQKPAFRLLSYNNADYSESEPGSIDAFPKEPAPHDIHWFDTGGIHEMEPVREIGLRFGLHDLMLESIVNTGTRPFYEDYGNCLFFNFKVLEYKSGENQIRIKQVSICLLENTVLTFQEGQEDVFKVLRSRIKHNRGKVRKLKADYLCFAMIDLVLDSYIQTVELFGDEIEELEEAILDDPDQDLLETINTYKREIIFLKKQIHPMRELVGHFSKSDSKLIHKSSQPFINSLNSTASHALEVIGSYRSLLNDFHQAYHTSISNKTNEVMKVLTIFSAIFIPMTFVAGVYGTNFEFLPELGFKYSYPLFLLLMLLMGLGMLRYFKNKGWL